MLVWWSIFGLCAPSLDWSIMAKASLSPIFVTFLITQLSGIPLLEQVNDRKYKGNQEYLRYKEETPLLLPIPRFFKVIN
jgi:steroid 5-alpha reductase family enzyme